MSRLTALDTQRVQETLATLRLRIEDRFPRSGLAELVGQIHVLSKEVEEQVASIVRPHLGIRLAATVVSLLIVAVLAVVVSQVHAGGASTWVELAQGLEASTSELVYLGAGFILLVTWETRIKRRRVIKAVSRLRELAHVVDMLQLTKDPDGVAGVSHKAAPHSPRRELDAWELGRYLDYCSETLSLIAKLGFFYVARFDDPEATNAVNQLEDLTNGLSRKIWQKIMILRSTNPAAAAGSSTRAIPRDAKPSLGTATAAATVAAPPTTEPA